MSRFIPVDPEKWAEMVKAQSDLPRWKEMCDELDARCNELKAELARLRAESIQDAAQLWQQSEELKRLRASSFVTAVPVEQYERVVKAGDAMANWMDELGSPRAVPFFQAWNAAKEGKPSV